MSGPHRLPTEDDPLSSEVDTDKTDVGNLFERVAKRGNAVDEQVALDALLRSLRSDRRSPVVLSRYILHRRLGSGGAGIVYVAYDPELDRSVAIKLLRTREGSESTRQQRLIREAQAMALLAHPNVVPVFDIGWFNNSDLDALSGVDAPAVSPLADGELGVFIVMEYVPGKDLDAWLVERPRAWREVVDAFLQAGRGLQEAHKRGLLHRDFKPANVLVAQDGRVRVFDFGLAQPLDGGFPSAMSNDELSPAASVTATASAWDLSLTATGLAVGTPAYMAPEQHDLKPATERSDQYAFCVALYKAIYGHLPFGHVNRHEAIRAKFAGIQRPPPNATRWAARPPQWLFKIIQRGLRPDPDDRFADMGELLAALARKPARRMAVWSGAAAVMAVAVGFGWQARAAQQRRIVACTNDGLAGIWEPATKDRLELAFDRDETKHLALAWQQARDQLDGFAVEWLRQRENACRDAFVTGDAALDAAHRRIRCLDGARIGLQAAVEVLRDGTSEVLGHAPQVVDSLPDLSECELEAEAPTPAVRRDDSELLSIERTRAKARALRTAHQFEASDELLADASQRARAANAMDLLARITHDQAENRLEAGDLEAAAAGFDEAIAIAIRAGAAREIVDILVRHAWVTGYWQEEYGTARELADLARAHLRRRPIEGEDRIELEVLVASLEGRQEHYDAATEMLVDIQQRYARELIGNDRLSSNIYDILAWCYRRMGRTKDALAAYRQSLYFHEREWGPNQPSNAGVYAAVAVSLLDDGQVGEARGQAQWALQLAELASKPTPELAMVHSVMGDISLAQGEWAQAEAEFRRTLQIQADLYGEGYSELPYGALAKTHLKRANWQTALELLRKGIALDPSRRTLARLRQFEGDALRGLGDPSSAISAYQQALALLDEVHPKTHPRHKDVLHNLGRSYAELREYEQGVAHFERALAVGNQWPAEFSAEERHSVRFDLVRALVHLDRQRAQELGLELHRDALLLPSGYAAEVWTWLQENRLAR